MAAVAFPFEILSSRVGSRSQLNDRDSVVANAKQPLELAAFVFELERREVEQIEILAEDHLLHPAAALLRLKPLTSLVVYRAPLAGAAVA